MTNYKRHSDEELVSAVAVDTSEEAYAEIYERYYYMVIGVCYKYLGDKGKAEDTTAELFERLPELIRKQSVQYFRAWLYTCARNACLMQLRKKKKEIPYDDFTPFDQPIQFLEEGEKELPLIPCLEALPLEQKQCIESFYFEKLTYVEVVEQTGFVLKQVKSYLQNGRRQLKKCLERSQSDE